MATTFSLIASSFHHTNCIMDPPALPRTVLYMQVKELHLSQRRAGRRTKEGYYWPSGKVSL